ncbi:MAG TPA: hypothetical protein PLZ55_02000 [bacterium]|nr:hypothetical protein [bacterium]HPO07414.1 hypothetical protein [bacterium]HQO35318.1 hypothetical protein [bacterium]HQP98629.1 hypothetical protein [bacterium]
MSEKLSERTKLLRDVSVTRAQVDNLRRLERLEQICEEQLIPLAPPEFPVLILPETPTGEASQEFDEPDNVQKSPPSPADLGSIACASKQKAID